MMPVLVHLSDAVSAECYASTREAQTKLIEIVLLLPCAKRQHSETETKMLLVRVFTLMITTDSTQLNTVTDCLLLSMFTTTLLFLLKFSTFHLVPSSCTDIPAPRHAMPTQKHQNLFSLSVKRTKSQEFSCLWDNSGQVVKFDRVRMKHFLCVTRKLERASFTPQRCVQNVRYAAGYACYCLR
jgi:hypothetical protein